MQLTNVERAAAALKAYGECVGEAPHESLLRDLLTDLMHFANRNGMNFQQEYSLAGYTFEQETAD